MRHASVLFGAFALTITSFAACGVTPGRPLTLAVFVGGVAGPAFSTPDWDISLDEARIAIGSIYLLAPAARTTRLERAREILLPVAYAHGGHDDYAALAVRAEWLGETTIDLLTGGQTFLGEGQGTVGETEYATLELAPPADASGPTHGHVAWVRGTATPAGGGDPIAFEGGLDLPDDVLSRSVESIACPFTMDANGQFELTIHASGRPGAAPSWLEEAQFDRLPTPTSGTVREIAPGTQPYVAWMLAARDATAFTTSYTPGAAR